jgi:poly-D-alanine transfer protein DltD
MGEHERYMSGTEFGAYSYRKLIGEGPWINSPEWDDFQKLFEFVCALNPDMMYIEQCRLTNKIWEYKKGGGYEG